MTSINHNHLQKVFDLLCNHGTTHREALKNYFPIVNYLKKIGLIRKVYMNKKVYYELTEQALPLLEEKRKVLFSEAMMLHQLNPRHINYAALLDDVRFFNIHTAEAEYFKFLGDWCLKLPVTKTRLTLAKYNYYYAQKN